MTGQQTRNSGAQDRHRIDRRERPLLLAAFLFSLAVNLLMLTGPLYMLQIYDRVLASRSEPTLVALTLLVTALFLFLTLLDQCRGAILARIGARMQQALDAPAFRAALTRAAGPVRAGDTPALATPRDVDAIRQFWSSQAATALFDLPWTPVYFAALFLFHPLLGGLALAGAAILCAIALLNRAQTRASLQRAQQATLAAERMAERLLAERDTIHSLGMTAAAFARWQADRIAALAAHLTAADRGGLWSTASRGFRLYLQSAMLGLAAWIVLHGDLSAGAMVAGSVLMGRALQPVEQVVAQWPLVTRWAEARRTLAQLLDGHPAPLPCTPLPRPPARLEVSALTLHAPGRAAPALQDLSFTLHPGQALGVIGPSGAGKSSLARAITGLWTAERGSIRLGGATPDQFDPDAYGRLIGHLPQRVALFDGTIAENIARLGPPDPDALMAAARTAAAHDMILRLPQGYDTRLDASGAGLSGGQIQRIALARALYGHPVLLVLDEPNSNLDHDGSLALNAAIRAQKAGGGAVLLMAHRPAALQECDLLLVLKDGRQVAFGPRDKVLHDTLRTAGHLRAQGAAQ